jgi:hypothetical protein
MTPLCNRTADPQRYAGERFYRPQGDFCTAVVLGILAGLALGGFLLLLTWATT